ncbi:hypothetical protein [Dyadobacter aurulentus]|uniref:hypothetical protein n=1 Tax=Dyadobacter sp. UC 10 TaxID=2605428 RepID=UPI0011F2A465|nr:hypothetical protein [Dyadobacter sp. UC 10]KAA0993345.1 hypothetical protein FXO21_25785 [Dyadobacter sp. UC 10]
MFFPKIYFFTILGGVLLTGCKDTQREEQLAAREQAVIRMEAEFAMKEADYRSLVSMRDSLLTRKDTVIIQAWPDAMAGIWNSKSVCRESTCTEYVIGDQRSNFWEFVSDSTGLFTRVVDGNNKVVRVYTAELDSTGIRLYFKSDSAASKRTDIRIDLSQVNADFFKGTQATNIDQACNAKFSVELTRTTKR